MSTAWPTADPQLGAGRGLHIGKRDHYRLAARILERCPGRVLLMQRSSTLILGPENGWEDEAVFFEAAWSSIRGGAEWLHIASTDGIRDHLARAGSHFPRRAEARRRLRQADDAITLGVDDRICTPVKRLPPERLGHDMKLDRQARLLIADFDGEFEAVIVIDVGDWQCSVHQAGPHAADLFGLCAAFWEDCPELTEHDLARLRSGVSRTG